MAKGKYEEWLTEENLLVLEAWAMDGLTNEQIAHNIGINVKTLWEWSEKHLPIRNALKKGREVADIHVENTLYKLACAGNVTAIIFWLKNRRPDKWRDKPMSPSAATDEKEAHNDLIEAIKRITQED